MNCKTAIGPRVMGGLGNVDWSFHVDSFMSQWITRYVDPATSQWKEILDSLLLVDKKGHPKHPEGRGVFFCRLSKGEKYRILKSLPKNATYIKECIRAHFRLGLEQNLDVERNSWTRSRRNHSGGTTGSPWRWKEGKSNTTTSNWGSLRCTTSCTPERAEYARRINGFGTS